MVQSGRPAQSRPRAYGTGPGHIAERDSLETLEKNGFFTTEKRQGELRVRLGEKGRQLLREVERQEVATPA
jgi:DNA-binding PadR family transcriptional regulator